MWNKMLIKLNFKTEIKKDTRVGWESAQNNYDIVFYFADTTELSSSFF